MNFLMIYHFYLRRWMKIENVEKLEKMKLLLISRMEALIWNINSTTSSKGKF